MQAAPELTTGVVVATHNRRERVLATLDRLAELQPEAPVVVVDNGSRDDTATHVRRRHPRIELIPLSRNIGAAARTIGARALAVPLVAISDDDSWWAAGALRRAAQLFARRPQLGLIAARILVGEEERLDPTCEDMRRSPLPRDPGLPGPAVLGFVACGSIVRRSAFLGVGGFHPRLGLGGEEHLLALDLASAGWELAYVDDVVAHHHPAEGGRSARSRVQRRNALWTLWLRRRLPSAIRHTARIARVARTGGQAGALSAAARGLPWILRERRPVPTSVERAAQLLEG
ncbi:MAG: glycosyltransferase [Thermoleophilaceae bacterium]|nr:glycosyltransferase [Thermoleophilaceae bacterium]